MKTLKESILSDIETQIDKGTSVVNNMAKIRELVPLFTDFMSVHYCRYDSHDWKNFSFNRSITYDGKFLWELKPHVDVNDFVSANDVYNKHKQHAYEKLFDIASKELKEIDLNEMASNRVKHNNSYLIFMRGTNYNEDTGRRPILFVKFVEKDFSKGRAKWRLSSIRMNMQGAIQIQQSIESRIKKQIGYRANEYDWFIFDINSNPDWGGIVDAVRDELNTKKLEV
jgi:hypothetical protein